MTRQHDKRRSGFTLIELVVVVAIIAVIAGMLLGAVMRVNDSKERLKVKDEMSKLETALANFESMVTKGGTNNHVPSRLLLREDGQYANQLGDIPPAWQGQYGLANESRAYLKQCFPKCSLVGMDWNGDGVIQNGTAGMYYLEGSQCLVFFLGGINRTRGFSTNELNPTDTRNDRIGPFFHFPLNRLNANAGSSPNAAFPGFTDPYEVMPYAFFSSYKRKDGYNKYGLPGTGTPPNVVLSDCSSLGVEPLWVKQTGPAAAPVREYHNPSGYQIICAGKDKIFGAGGQYPPAVNYGWDDMANFHPAKLGSTP